MKKKIFFIAAIIALILSAHVMTAYAAEDEPMIQRIEDEEAQVEQYATIYVSVAKDVDLPLTVKMDNSSGTITMYVKENGDAFNILPTTYTIKGAKSDSGKEYTAGAKLKISDDGGPVFLDFNKPQTNEDGGLPTWIKILIANVAFLGIATAAFKIFTWYREHLS